MVNKLNLKLGIDKTLESERREVKVISPVLDTRDCELVGRQTKGGLILLYELFKGNLVIWCVGPLSITDSSQSKGETEMKPAKSEG